jgi:hypothetical protein
MTLPPFLEKFPESCDKIQLEFNWFLSAFQHSFNEMSTSATRAETFNISLILVETT